MYRTCITYIYSTYLDTIISLLFTYNILHSLIQPACYTLFFKHPPFSRKKLRLTQQKHTVVACCSGILSCQSCHQADQTLVFQTQLLEDQAKPFEVLCELEYIIQLLG